MAAGDNSAQVRVGMVAYTADGTRLGLVTQVHARDTETYVEVTPRGNLWKPWQLLVAVQRLYLPGSTVMAVRGKHVQVAMDAKTAKGCTGRPTWIPRDSRDAGGFW